MKAATKLVLPPSSKASQWVIARPSCCGQAEWRAAAASMQFDFCLLLLLSPIHHNYIPPWTSAGRSLPSLSTTVKSFPFWILQPIDFLSQRAPCLAAEWEWPALHSDWRRYATEMLAGDTSCKCAPTQQPTELSWHCMQMEANPPNLGLGGRVRFRAADVQREKREREAMSQPVSGCAGRDWLALHAPLHVHPSQLVWSPLGPQNAPASTWRWADSLARSHDWILQTKR